MTRRKYESSTGICTDCGEECETLVVDNGIGSYEYGGSKGVDTRLEVVSDCCQASVTDSRGLELEVKDLEEAFDVPEPR